MNLRCLTRLALISLAIWLGACAGTVRNTSRTFTKVVIDAGHGGHDSGATTRYAGREKDLALDVALRLQPRLEAAGFKTVMTRSTDKFIPLDTRARISNTQSNSVFVSIHFNYATRSAVSGSEVYYNSRPSIGLANHILTAVAALPGCSWRGVRTANFRVLKKNRYPAVLVECGYLTNRTEGRRCTSPAHREALAAAIARGIIEQRGGPLKKAE